MHFPHKKWLKNNPGTKKIFILKNEINIWITDYPSLCKKNKSLNIRVCGVQCMLKLYPRFFLINLHFWKLLLCSSLFPRKMSNSSDKQTAIAGCNDGSRPPVCSCKAAGQREQWRRTGGQDPNQPRNVKEEAPGTMWSAPCAVLGPPPACLVLLASAGENRKTRGLGPRDPSLFCSCWEGHGRGLILYSPDDHWDRALIWPAAQPQLCFKTVTLPPDGKIINFFFFGL